METATLIKLRSYLRIAHHIPGRIRIKVNPALFIQPDALRLAAQVDLGDLGRGNGHPAIINSRINKNAGSLVLEYDPRMIAPAMFEDLFRARDENRVEQLVEHLADLLGLQMKPLSQEN